MPQYIFRHINLYKFTSINIYLILSIYSLKDSFTEILIFWHYSYSSISSKAFYPSVDANILFPFKKKEMEISFTFQKMLDEFFVSSP